MLTDQLDGMKNAPSSELAVYLDFALNVVKCCVYFPSNDGWREMCLKKVNDLVDKTLKAKYLSEASRAVLLEIVQKRPGVVAAAQVVPAVAPVQPVVAIDGAAVATA